MSTPPSAVLDSGLQSERTALAWRRTALSIGAAGLAGVRWAVHAGSLWVALVACGALVAAGALGGLSAQRYRRSWHLWASAGGEPTRVPPGARTMATCSALLVLAGAAAATAELLA